MANLPIRLQLGHINEQQHCHSCCIAENCGMTGITLIGCGFVADLYMQSLATFPHIKVLGAYDRDEKRRAAFCAHWSIPQFDSLDMLFQNQPRDGVVLNLTNPKSHFEINMACLESGFHVWSEKPLAMTMADARKVSDTARSKGVQLGSAPCSVLGQAAQTLAQAVRENVAGTPRLIYAELDDGFIPQAPLEAWKSASGAPWPYEDEFQVGCTLEHAGYYMSWLIGMFGSVRSVTAASATVMPDKLGVENCAPDFSTATLFFENGPVTRLTCSITAPHDHQLRVIGDKGMLKLDQAWDNGAPIKFHARKRIRRRLVDMPFGRKIRFKGEDHPKVGRWGAASMNFALGPVEMLQAIAAGRPSRLSGDYALHLNEVTLAIQNAGDSTGAQTMTTGCAPMEPMDWSV